LPPNGKCSKCPTGYTETMSSSGYQTCIAPQPPKFVGFRAADGIQATGHLEVVFRWLFLFVIVIIRRLTRTSSSTTTAI
jgi:hypothetical protein